MSDFRKLFEGNIPVIIDTDTANEADDQFAVVYAALTASIKLDAVLIAPFSNGIEKDPFISIDRSMAEAERFLGLAGADVPVIEGSREFLRDTATPVESPAAKYLVERLSALPEGEKMVICAIGCGTNIASALLKEPGIADKMILLWQVGHVPECPEGGEFNMCQDVNAARVIFASSVELIQLPAYGAASEILLSVGEMRCNINGKSDVGTALFSTLCTYIGTKGDGTDDGRQKIIWDIASVGVLAGCSATFDEHPRRVRLSDTEFIEADGSLTVCRGLNKDEIFLDMCKKIGGEEV